MSLYPQNYYGQPSYVAPPVQPPHNGYHHPYQQPYQTVPTHPAPQPLPVYHVDPVTFRRDYSSRLSELTVNSRPIIQNLSYIAQEYSRFADIVAECIEAHIRRVPPWMKLPAFYLLDAISKNLFEPYAHHFAAFVTQLFIDTYQVVDPSTRSKMEEMLLTWRTASPAGKELFGVPPQVAIERGVWGAPASRITPNQVLRELEFALGQKERALQSNPYDEASQKQTTVLHQLRALVEAGVSQEQLQQILNQLRASMRSNPSQPAPPAQSAIPPPGQLPTQPYPSQPSTSAQPPQPSTTQPFPGAVSALRNLKLSEAEIGNQVNNAVPLLATAAAVPSPNIANILSSLVKAGIVSASNPAPSQPAPIDDQPPHPVAEEDREKEAIRSYRQLVLALPVKLNSNDILRQRPAVVELLYKRLSVQCKQCGLRFAD